MEHHTLDVYPLPKEKAPLYINEPWLIDCSLLEVSNGSAEPEQEQDNIRVYIPLDINKNAILRRLDLLIVHYGEANEKNEIDFSIDVDMLVSQIEIYDQIWYVRHMPETGDHSREAVELVKEFIARLEEIPDGCAELFPFELLNTLRKEYLRQPADSCSGV